MKKTKLVFSRDEMQMLNIETLKSRGVKVEDIAKIADTFAAFQEGKLEDEKGFCTVGKL